MTPTLKAVPIPPTPTEKLAEASGERPLLWLIYLLSARVAGLEEERERLLIAVRRESHHMDVRAPHSGR